MKKAAKDVILLTQEMSLESHDPLPSPAQLSETDLTLWFDQNKTKLKEESPECKRTGSVGSAKIQVSFRRGTPNCFLINIYIFFH
jgi:hypothetical protein